MKIKSEKAFTGIDITIAIIVITTFVAIISVLFYNINFSTEKSETKSKATYYAIDEIEKIKIMDFSEICAKEGELECQNVQLDEGYYKTIEIIDYRDTIENEVEKDDILENMVKIAKVTISYKVGKNEEKVEISIVISK